MYDWIKNIVRQVCIYFGSHNDHRPTILETDIQLFLQAHYFPGCGLYLRINTLLFTNRVSRSSNVNLDGV